MILFILLIICFILLSFQFTGGGEYYCVGVSKKNNELVRREFICHEFITYLRNSIEDRKAYNFVKNYIFLERGYPSFTDNQHLRDLDKKITAYNKGGDIPTIKKKFRELEKTHQSIGIVRGNCLWRIPVKSLPNRDRWKYKYTEIEKQAVSLKYANFNELSPGDQWSLYSDKDMEKLTKAGFLIETFGSTFNARLKYFGSISEVDEPFGRLGTYDEILQKIIDGKEIKWRDQVVNNGRAPIKFTANPPSSGSIQFNTVMMILQIMQKKRKVEAHIHISNSFYERIKETDKDKLDLFREYVTKEEIAQQAYSLYDGQVKDMTGREWILIICKN